MPKVNERPATPPPPLTDAELKGTKRETMQSMFEREGPPSKWAIPGLLCEGLSILGGKPKSGKSWLALNISMTIALGGKVMGSVQTEPGDVLYLALEDRRGRIRDRGRKVLPALGVEGKLDRLQFLLKVPTLDQGGFLEVATWMKEVPKPTLLVVDVWEKFRPESARNNRTYSDDYKHAAALKELADEKGCSILLIFHTKKAACDDVLEELMGTNGSAGAADTITVLKRDRLQDRGTLFITGRDIKERSLNLEFSPDTCTWKEVARSGEEVPTGLARAIKEFLISDGGFVFTKDIAKAVGETQDQTRMTLHRMRDKKWVEQHKTEKKWRDIPPGE